MFKITNKEIYLTRGDNARMHVSATDKITGDSYVPQDGDTVSFSLKKKVKDEEPLIFIEQTDHTETGWYITFMPEHTNKLSFGDYLYDIQLITANGWVDTIIEPTKFTVAEEVTR